MSKGENQEQASVIYAPDPSSEITPWLAGKILSYGCDNTLLFEILERKFGENVVRRVNLCMSEIVIDMPFSSIDLAEEIESFLLQIEIDGKGFLCEACVINVRQFRRTTRTSQAASVVD